MDKISVEKDETEKLVSLTQKQLQNNIDLFKEESE